MEEIIVAASEYERLKSEIRRLRAEVSGLTVQRDELKLRECPRIEAEYNARIGTLEFRVFQAKNRVLELKRAIEILQAARNRREEKTGEDAERQARGEYREYEEDLKRKADEINRFREYRKREEEHERRWKEEQNRAGEGKNAGEDATGERTSGQGYSGNGADSEIEELSDHVGSGADEGSAGETDREAGTSGPEKKFRSRKDELKYYYRLLIKRLHPDSNPNQTAEDAQLLQQVMKAYADGDLDALKDIYDSLKARRPESDFRDTAADIEEMKAIAASLEKKILELRKEIETIRNNYPYKWKELLENEEMVSAYQKKLSETLSIYEKQYQELLVRFRDLQRG